MSVIYSVAENGGGCYGIHFMRQQNDFFWENNVNRFTFLSESLELGGLKVALSLISTYLLTLFPTLASVNDKYHI